MTLAVDVNSKEVQKALKQIVRATRTRLKSEVRKAAISTRSKAKKFAPKASNTLRRSIKNTRPKVDGRSISAEVYSEALYAPFVEGRQHTFRGAYGMTSVVGVGRGPGKMPPAEPIKAWLKTKGLPPEMLFPVRRKIGKRGTKAQPFMRPAVQQVRPVFIKACEDAINHAAREAGFLMGVL
jgi:HK97 gp10 family phage protein